MEAPSQIESGGILRRTECHLGPLGDLAPDQRVRALAMADIAAMPLPLDKDSFVNGFSGCPCLLLEGNKRGQEPFIVLFVASSPSFSGGRGQCTAPRPRVPRVSAAD